MVVTFFGHSHFVCTEEHERKVLGYLENRVGNQSAEMYLGGYGAFDSFAYNCCKKYKETHPNVSLVFVTPYMSVEYQRNHLEYQKTVYDSILYPELENVPPRYAIPHRNKYMVEKADCVVVYVERSFGGAYTAYKHAKRKHKEIFNLADFSE